jgi:hypothetical protein
MREFLWRVLYAAICFVLFWWIFPLFISIIGVPVSGALMQLIRIVTAAIALLYALFGPAPPMPF